MNVRVESAADARVRECLSEARSFAMIAGAGAGKTTSLVDALLHLRDTVGQTLQRNGQRVACITFTNRAVDVIRERVGPNELYHITTIHGFLWDQLKHFQEDLLRILLESLIPEQIQKARESDNGGQSQKAIKARAKIERLSQERTQLAQFSRVEYVNSPFGSYGKGQIGHDDVIYISSRLLVENPTYRAILGSRFPYILVDEAQDAFEGVIEGLNAACGGTGLPIVGYFGDPWQQIYERGTGEFAPPPGGELIYKSENFRCSCAVISLLNAFRSDLQQYPAGSNRNCAGGVHFSLIRSESPEEARNRYSDAQIDRAQQRLDRAIDGWGWGDDESVKRLFLVRQMIARRLGFASLHRTFTGPYASARAKDSYEVGDHYLLRPFVSTICPLVAAHAAGKEEVVIDILRHRSPAFRWDGPNAARSLTHMIEEASRVLTGLDHMWRNGDVGDVLRFALSEQLVPSTSRLLEEVQRPPREEEYDEEHHGAEKGEWLATALFALKPEELSNYATFLAENTAFSTQHGVKGEEYPRVLVVLDDIEAAWGSYSFTKVLTPGVSGAPTSRQEALTRRLAYVSFSRAIEELRVAFFTPDPARAAVELINAGLLSQEQISLLD